MRIGLLASVTLLATACSSSSTTLGAVHLTFGDSASELETFTTTPAGAAMIVGSFSVVGDYAGQYTLTTSVPTSSPIASCLVSVDGGTPSTSVPIDGSTSQTHTVTVAIEVGLGYDGQAVCNVSALNDARKNIGESVTIVVTTAADAG
jgi:hypothetical protein